MQFIYFKNMRLKEKKNGVTYGVPYIKNIKKSKCIRNAHPDTFKFCAAVSVAEN